MAPKPKPFLIFCCELPTCVIETTKAKHANLNVRFIVIYIFKFNDSKVGIFVNKKRHTLIKKYALYQIV
jgi:hypothetical protein